VGTTSSGRGLQEPAQDVQFKPASLAALIQSIEQST
jgi:hypothetical protein